MTNDTTPPKTTKPKARLATLLASIAIILALASAGYNIWQSQQIQSSVNQQNSSLQNTLTDHYSTQQENLQQLSSQYADLQKTVTTQGNTVTILQHQLQQTLANHDGDGWILSEARYLINLADFNLRYQHNVQTTIPLLQNALQLVNQIHSLNVTDLKQALTNNITVLQTANLPNITQIVMQLQAINQQVPRLPLLVESETNQANANINKKFSTVPQSGWRAALEHTWQELQKIIIIRHSSEGIKPVLDLVQQDYVKQNLQLLLAQAQLATLQQNNLLYRVTLIQAQQWLTEYFALNNYAVAQVHNQLQQLAQINIAPPLPDLSSTLQAVAKAYTSVAQAKPTTTTPGAGI